MSSQMEVYPKKRLGQHFLRDRVVLNRLVEVIQPTPGDVLLEIGAGTGALTAQLAPRVAKLFAIECDRDVLPALARAVAPWPSVTVIHEDVLNLDLSRFGSGMLAANGLRVAGNLPYNIGTAIIGRFLYSQIPVSDMTFMLQMEVAQRLVAKPGTKSYGYLSVECQHRADVRVAFKVHPGSFAPPPKVMSAVVVLRPKPHLFTMDEESGFLAVARAAFGHRRKTLLNALKHSTLPSAAFLPGSAGVDGSRRPEQVTVGEYENMGRILAEMS
jgi:16S rRNA (adenine1518-N6/adenine1519-N6)-dimethyltransferase